MRKNCRMQFLLLFQHCNVHKYAVGNRRFLYFLYILMKYILLFSNNLNRIFNSLVIEHHRNPMNRFLIKIYKLSSATIIVFSMSASSCKLILLSVRGIGNFKKRKIIFTWCRKQKSDFIFLQETHSKKT